MTTPSEDFEFWVDNLPDDHPQYRDHSVEFQASSHNEDHFGLGAWSPPLWKRPSRSSTLESSSRLVPYNYRYSPSSPTSRFRAVANGRREIMRMINDIPESSYELSLKDIVEDKHRHSTGTEKNGRIIEEMDSNKKNEPKNYSRKKSKTSRSQISKTQSMDRGASLLKTLFPIPPAPSSKKKISPGPSLAERSKKHADKDWWKTIFPSTKDKNEKSTSIRRSLSDVSCRKTSLIVNRDFMPRQFSLNSKKYESNGQRGCCF